MTRKRLDELLAKLEPALAKRFREAMERVRGRRSVAKLEAALEAGDGELASVLDEVEHAAASFSAGVAAGHALVAGEVAAYLTSRLDRTVSYDATKQRAVDALARNRAMLGALLREGQRQAFGEVLRQSAQGGWDRRQTATALRDSIGLTAQQTSWVANYRRNLESASRGALENTLRDARGDKAVAGAIERGKPLPQARIDKLVERYADRLLMHRADALAAEGARSALEAAQDEAYQQAADDGHLSPDRVQLEWHQHARPTMRDIHRPMDGMLRRLGVPFRSGSGALLRYPHDPDVGPSENRGCDCYVTRRILPEGQVAINSGEEAAPVELVAAPVDASRRG